MARATSEQKVKVLADIKAKKTITETAKAHGLSRSAVYRILDGEKRRELTAAPAPAPQQQAADDDSASESEDEGVSKDFFMKNDKFADDLGLPQDSRRINHSADEQEAHITEEMEEELDGMMGRILGAPAVASPFPLQRGTDMSSLMDKIAAHPQQFEAQHQKQHQQLMPPPSRYDREDLIQRIVFNVQHFGSLLETITGNKEAFIASLAVKDGPELKHLLTTLERTRSVGTISAGFKQVFYIAAQGVEVTSGLVGVKSNGFVAQLQQQDEEIGMCMKEIALNEWERLKNLDSPQVRLGMMFCLTLAQTHTRNEMLSYRDAPLNPELSKANEDL
jgi:hypothetical protein